MAEKLTLTTPETFPDLDDWEIDVVSLHRRTPAIKVTAIANTGEQVTKHYVPDDEDPTAETEIRAGLSLINQGKFKTVQGISLQRWLLEKLRDDGALGAGTVSGTPD